MRFNAIDHKTQAAIDEDEKRTKGTIRPTSRFRKCSKCHQPFLHIFKIGYFCATCDNKPGRYCIDLHWKGQRYRICSDRQRKPLDKYGPAFDQLSVIRGEIDNGTFNPAKYVPTLRKQFYASTLLNEFLEDKLKCIAPSYRAGYKKQVARHKDHFGDTDVKEIETDDFFTYLEFLKIQRKKDGSRLKSGTILNNFDNLKTFMRYLKKEKRLLTTLPDFPTEKEIEVRMEEIVLNEAPFHYSWFKTEDQIRILDAIESNWDKDIIKFLMLHGCRPGEARALRVTDVNIETLSITIKSTYSKNTLRSRRKGKKSKPYLIAIHPEMIDFFRRRVKNHPEAFIFINPKTGGPYMVDAFQAIFVGVRSKLNIPKEVRLYDASRHSFVTQLRKKGLAISEVSKLVGHSTEKTTADIYDHADDLEIEMKRMAIAKLSLRKNNVIANIHIKEELRHE